MNAVRNTNANSLTKTIQNKRKPDLESSHQATFSCVLEDAPFSNLQKFRFWPGKSGVPLCFRQIDTCSTQSEHRNGGVRFVMCLSISGRAHAISKTRTNWNKTTSPGWFLQHFQKSIFRCFFFDFYQFFCIQWIPHKNESVEATGNT